MPERVSRKQVQAFEDLFPKHKSDDLASAWAALASRSFHTGITTIFVKIMRQECVKLTFHVTFALIDAAVKNGD